MARARAANPLRRRALVPLPLLLLPLLLALAAAAAAAAAEAGAMAAMAATATPPASLLYSLRVGGAGGGQGEAEALEVRAGEDPVLVALRYCRAHGIGEQGCAQIMQHLCRDTDLLCRSRESLAGRSQKASVVGSAMASWRTTSLDLAGLGDPVECALEVQLLDNDVEKDVELEGNATYLASLVSLHCTNLGRFRPACVCPPGVRAGLVEGLVQESERYRWSASSSHYVRLGVDARADAHEIRRAYRRVSMQVHPDRHRAGEDRRAAEYRATLVNEAYEVLSNVGPRRAYDIERFGRQFVAQTELPRYRAEASSVFGRFAGVSMDAHGNIKIVL